MKIWSIINGTEAGKILFGFLVNTLPLMIIALLALSTWRKEAASKLRVDAAQQCIAAFYNLSDVIEVGRAPISFRDVTPANRLSKIQEKTRIVEARLDEIWKAARNFNQKLRIVRFYVYFPEHYRLDDAIVQTLITLDQQGRFASTVLDQNDFDKSDVKQDYEFAIRSFFARGHYLPDYNASPVSSDPALLLGVRSKLLEILRPHVLP